MHGRLAVWYGWHSSADHFICMNSKHALSYAIWAVQAAKAHDRTKGKDFVNTSGVNEDDFVTWSEFRVLLAYLRQCVALCYVLECSDIHGTHLYIPIQLLSRVPSSDMRVLRVQQLPLLSRLFPDLQL